MNKRRKKVGPLKDKEGSSYLALEDVDEVWNEHFASVFTKGKEDNEISVGNADRII